MEHCTHCEKAILTGKFALFCREEPRTLDIGGENEHGYHGIHDGKETFKYEDPSPASKVAYAVHMSDSGGEESTKGVYDAACSHEDAGPTE